MVQPAAVWGDYQLWRIFTYMWLHDPHSVMHIAMATRNRRWPQGFGVYLGLCLLLACANRLPAQERPAAEKPVHKFLPVEDKSQLSLAYVWLDIAEEATAAFEDARRRFERDYLVRVLKLTQGSVTHAARMAKRNRTEFYKLLQRHRLEPAMFKEAKG